MRIYWQDKYQGVTETERMKETTNKGEIFTKEKGRATDENCTEIYSVC